MAMEARAHNPQTAGSWHDQSSHHKFHCNASTCSVRNRKERLCMQLFRGRANHMTCTPLSEFSATRTNSNSGYLSYLDSFIFIKQVVLSLSLFFYQQQK
eukprot:TRINITY_DN60795_c0_g1_i1.p1 TRINITY_DN60795_c0_g1~~TRINITY_DN60795_c0_g1_i1.p1  ORF type:complete len:110 (-),score=8.85 TRINITY_DN60795_c0_g1_i1:90-386(-)